MTASPNTIHCACGNPACLIPFGFCHCGCGRKTSISKRNRTKLKHVKGLPVRFCNGHFAEARIDFSEAAPFKIDGVYCKLIPLTRGQFAIVDAEDYPELSKHKWCAFWESAVDTHYAIRAAISHGEHEGIYMHRQILDLCKGDARQADHRIPANGLDNRRKNLRIATLVQNNQNKRRYKNNTSGVKGVYWHKQKQRYSVKIQANKERFLGGEFSSLEDARKARSALAHKLHGEFCNNG
jgi:hypothetical protein